MATDASDLAPTLDQTEDKQDEFETLDVPQEETGIGEEGEGNVEDEVENILNEEDGAQAATEGDAEGIDIDVEVAEDVINETEGDETKLEEDEEAAKEEEEEEDDAEEEEEVTKEQRNADPNVMPQVNVAVLAKRKWQVKVYPLKPSDFVSGQISRVFKNAKESLLYILSPGKYALGKGEMYISSVNQTVKVVQNLMKLDFQYPEINIEVVRKNDEGVIEEQAYMRFDSKLVRMLCVPVHAARRIGNKRERIIGSVFVKNLPNTTTKDMLRVMFPFAQEINYNPEKFKDGTARLVLNNRSAVFPCLKAFAKVELGGNVLELHPLEKRKKTSEDMESRSSKRSEKSGSEHRKRDDSKKESGSKSDSENKASESKTVEVLNSSQTEEKSESKSSGSQKDPPRKSPGSAKLSDKQTDLDARKGSRNRWWMKRKAAILEKRRGSDVERRPLSHGSKGDDRKPYAGRDTDKVQRIPASYHNRGGRGGAARNIGNRNEKGAFGRRGKVLGRNRPGSSSGLNRRNRGFDDRAMRAGFSGAAGGGDMGTEATKEMMLLQSQLSMAIKNQLSMLNQTQLAVEQAKRGAGGSGLGREAARSGLGGRMSDHYGMAQLAAEQARRGRADSARDRQYVNRSRSRDRGLEDSLGVLGSGYGYKRSAELAGLDDGYGGAGYGKRRGEQMAGYRDPASWADERNTALYNSTRFEYNDADRAAELGNVESRTFGAGNLNYGYRY